VLLAVALAAGVWLRIDGVRATPLFGDEHHSLFTKDRSYREILSSFDDRGSHLALPLLQRLAEDALGPGLASYRLPAVLPGILALPLCFLVARRLVGSTAALLATWALALNPMHVYYSRFARAYALALFLGLALLWAVSGLGRRGTDTRGPAILAFLCATLLPVVHLSSAGYVLALALVCLWLVWSRNHAPGPVVATACLFALAALFSAALHLPARAPLLAYLSRITAERAAAGPEVLDVLTLLAGGRVAGLFWLVGVPVAAVLLSRASRPAALLLCATIAGPAFALWASAPQGNPYAYARYLLVSLPAVLMLLAWLARATVERWQQRKRLALGLGLLLIAAGHLGGPLSGRHPAGDPFTNTYLRLAALPPFDIPYRDTPAFYRQLAADPEAARIIEVPQQRGRSVLLYRNYALQHRKDVLVGWEGRWTETLRHGPYVDMRAPDIEARGADYLVVHHDIGTEVAAYLDWVFRDAASGRRDPSRAALMEHQRSLKRERHPRRFSIAALDRRHGPPHYRDARISVWALGSAK
jgi:hypothetical protein